MYLLLFFILYFYFIRFVSDLTATVDTGLLAHPPGWAYECLGPSVSLEFEPTPSGLIIQCERYL